MEDLLRQCPRCPESRAILAQLVRVISGNDLELCSTSSNIAAARKGALLKPHCITVECAACGNTGWVLTATGVILRDLLKEKPDAEIPF